jgi:YD repeat-containing protein
MPSKIAGPDGRSVTFTSSPNSIVITDSDGQTTTLERDSSGRIVKVQAPGQRITTIIWDKATTASKQYNLITGIIDPNGLATAYTYDAPADSDGRLHGVIRTSRDVVAAHLFTYTSEKTAVENAVTELTFDAKNAKGARVYEPMGYVEYLFASNGSDRWDRYVTTVLGGLTRRKTFFRGHVEQDSKGRITKTVDSYGFTQVFRYSGDTPFPSEILHHDGTTTAYQRDGKDQAFAAKQINLLTPARQTLYTQAITWAGPGRPSAITAGPIDNSYASMKGAALPSSQTWREVPSVPLPIPGWFLPS